MAQAIRFAVLAAMLACEAFAQPATPPRFEVASIKPGDAEAAGSGITTTIGRISARNVTLKRCMRGAYGVEEARILGGPKWLDEDRFQIDAKAPEAAGDHDLMIMLQSLLAERFKLSFHHEKRMLPGYQLVAGKGGLKAKASEPGAGSRTNSSGARIEAQACTMANLALKLSEALHLPVADLTAIEGRFDFKLAWTPENLQARPPAAGDKPVMAPAGPSLFDALQEQLGLKLQPSKVPADVLVIDHAEKPAEN
jgi:uncharacterized protein (TIGR03435 family)